MDQSTRYTSENQAEAVQGCGVTSAPDGRDPAYAGRTPARPLSFPGTCGTSQPIISRPGANAEAGGAPAEPGARRPPVRGFGGGAPAMARQYRNKWPRPAGKLRYVAACEAHAWTLVSWRKDRPGEKSARRYECGSWRHAGECRRWKGSQDFARVKAAVASRKSWTYIVLTFDPKRWHDKYAAYKGAISAWAKLRKRMTRAWGRIEYIQTWEQHSSGWPHVNILVHNEALADACADDGWKKVRKDWLEPNAIDCGFGMRTWIEPMRQAEAISGYLVKLANKLTAELTDAGVKDQVPVDAPKNFRRLRASQGLLPPAYTAGEEWTGELRQDRLEYVEAELQSASTGGEPCSETSARSPRDSESSPRSSALRALISSLQLESATWIASGGSARGSSPSSASSWTSPISWSDSS